LALHSVYVYERNNEKIIAKYLFDNTGKLSKFYLNQTSIAIKRKKNLIQKEANKFSNVSKFRINVFQFERVI